MSPAPGAAPAEAHDGKQRLWSRRNTRVYFKNEDLDVYLTFVLGRAPTRSASVGEAMRAASLVDPKKPATWSAAWHQAGAMAEAQGDVLLPADRLGAADAFLRASTYYRAAIFGEGVADGVASYERSAKTFQRAAALLDPPIEPLEITWDGWRAPGYFMRADSSGEPRPTILLFLGGETVAEDGWAWIGQAAARRGWNTIVAEPPGWLGFRALNPQFPRVTPATLESFFRPYVDAACAHPEVDQNRLVAAGYSGGGFIGLRAAALDSRIKALVADAPILDFHRLLAAELPSLLVRSPGWLLEKIIRIAGAANPFLRVTMEKFQWQFGVDTAREWLDVFAGASNEELISNLAIPMLALAGEGESPEQRRQAQQAVDMVPGSSLRIFTTAEGADAHTQVNHPALMQETIFAWLAAQGFSEPTAVSTASA